VRTFFDSSSFAKRYIEEKGSQLVDYICQEATELSISMICIPEIISALNRRIREKNLSLKDYHIIKQALSDDVRDILIINLTEEVISINPANYTAWYLLYLSEFIILCRYFRRILLDELQSDLRFSPFIVP